MEDTYGIQSRIGSIIVVERWYCCRGSPVFSDRNIHYGEKYGYHTHYLPLQAAVDFLAEQFEMMQTASLTVDRDMTVCQCEYRKEGGET